MRHAVDSSYGLITFKGKLLLLLRDNTPTIPSPNCWSLIGGGSERNETPIMTYFREAKEEANITPKNTRFLFILKGNGSKRYIFHSCLSQDDFDQIKLGNEGQYLGFFRFAELKTIQLGKTMTFILMRYRYLLRELLR
jgi:8-oxo-dGTP pyrophosphatase MutT (NUDIX family)